MATIRKKGELQWHCQIRRKGFPPQTRTFETRQDAEAWARSVERDMDRGEHKDTRTARATTLKQVLESYRDSKMIKNKGSEVDAYRLNVFLNSSLAKYSMVALTDDVIEKWAIDFMLERGIKGSTINRYLNFLSAACGVGIKKLKLNISNPLQSVDRPLNPEHRERRIGAEEERRLIDALIVPERVSGKFAGMQNSWIKPLVELALETGMRRGELLGLEWRYIDKSRRIAHIPDTKNGREGAPVSRDVPLSAKALAILEGMPRHVGGKVFATTGDALKKSFSRAVVRARRKYELDCANDGETPLARILIDLHFHDLRHEATSRLAKIYDIKQLAKIGGWKDLNTLARYYNPTTDELVQRMVKHEASLTF